MPCATAQLIYILGICGIPWPASLHELPAALGNQIITCHWMANGIEVENPTTEESKDALIEFEQITKREHKWL